MALVVAPAGYGKTTLVCDWLQSTAQFSAWLSLDEHDNDLIEFLQYFVAAIQTIVPDACPNTVQLLQTLERPTSHLFAVTLLNDLTNGQDRFAIILDDYHLIHDQEIHQFMADFVEYLPQQIHLLIISRTEPLLPLAKLRTRRQLTEIRAADLRFSPEDTARWLQQTIGLTVTDDLLTTIYKQTEGWAAGIQLVAMTVTDTQTFALRHGSTLAQHFITEYLLDEVIAKQPDSVKTFLRIAAVLERFCAPLCHAIMADGPSLATEVVYQQESFNTKQCSTAPFVAAQTTIEYLLQQNLFVIALDANNHWYRFHHLFQEMLQSLLRKECSIEQIAAIHARAGHWFAQHQLVNEALYHFSHAHEDEAAAELVEQHRHKLLNEEDFRTLKRWIDALPVTVANRRPALLLTQGWLAQANYQVAKIGHIIEQTTEALSEMISAKVPLPSEVNDTTLYPANADTPNADTPNADTQSLQSELEILCCAFDYWRGDFEMLFERAQRAISHLDPGALYVRGLAVTAIGLGYHFRDEIDMAIESFQREIGVAEVNSRYRLLLESELGNVQFLAAKLHQADETLRMNRYGAAKKKMGVGDGWTLVRLGEIYYEWNDLEKACNYFQECVNHLHIIHVRTAFICLRDLAITYHALGQVVEAEQTVQQLYEFLLERNHHAALNEFRALPALLALQAGDSKRAEHYMAIVDTAQSIHANDVIGSPLSISCRILLASGSKEHLILANSTIEELMTRANTNNNYWLKIQAFCLQALYHQARNALKNSDETNSTADQQQAIFTALTNAFTLAEQDGFIRTFVDFGAPMANLISQFIHHKKTNGIESTYLYQLLEAFPTTVQDTNRTSLPTLYHNNLIPVVKDSRQTHVSLTDREHEILSCLAARYSNKEIAQELIISPLTVKRHTTNIYQKLHVKNRKQAVAKANALGLL